MSTYTPGEAFQAAKKALEAGEKNLERFKDFMLPSDWIVIQRMLAKKQDSSSDR